MKLELRVSEISNVASAVSVFIFTGHIYETPDFDTDIDTTLALYERGVFDFAMSLENDENFVAATHTLNAGSVPWVQAIKELACTTLSNYGGMLAIMWATDHAMEDRREANFHHLCNPASRNALPWPSATDVKRFHAAMKLHNAKIVKDGEVRAPTAEEIESIKKAIEESFQ